MVSRAGLRPMAPGRWREAQSHDGDDRRWPAGAWPATAETLEEVLASGCRYIYTHLPRLIGGGAGAFLATR